MRIDITEMKKQIDQIRNDYEFSMDSLKIRYESAIKILPELKHELTIKVACLKGNTMRDLHSIADKDYEIYKEILRDVKYSWIKKI
jgi:hypothetical protein